MHPLYGGAAPVEHSTAFERDGKIRHIEPLHLLDFARQEVIAPTRIGVVEVELLEKDAPLQRIGEVVRMERRIDDARVHFRWAKHDPQLGTRKHLSKAVFGDKEGCMCADQLVHLAEPARHGAHVQARHDDMPVPHWQMPLLVEHDLSGFEVRTVCTSAGEPQAAGVHVLSGLGAEDAEVRCRRTHSGNGLATRDDHRLSDRHRPRIAPLAVVLRRREKLRVEKSLEIDVDRMASTRDHVFEMQIAGVQRVEQRHELPLSPEEIDSLSFGGQLAMLDEFAPTVCAAVEHTCSAQRTLGKLGVAPIE